LRHKRNFERPFACAVFLIFAVLCLSKGYCEPLHEGTIGSVFTIVGEGFGTKKPKVYLEMKGEGANTKRYAVKVQTWSDTSLTCLWKKKAPAGDYGLWVKPKTKGADPMYMGLFRVMAPSIHDVEPFMPSSGHTVTVSGTFFSTNKPKIYLENTSKTVTKKCRVTGYSMDPATGDSSLQFVAPFNITEGDTLVLTNKVGEDTFVFTEVLPPVPEPDPDPTPTPDPPTPDPTPDPDPPMPLPNPDPDPPMPLPNPDPDPPLPQ
jgi:hypothetical protein